MGDTILRDSRSGNPAHVDDHGRVYVLADLVSHWQHHTMHHKDAFMVNSQLTLSQDGRHWALWFHNDGSKNYNFEIYFLSASTNGKAKFTLCTGVTRISGGGGTLLDHVNTMIGHQSTPDAEIYGGNPTIDTSDEKVMRRAFVGAYIPQAWDVQGGIAIPPGKSFAISVEREEAVTTEVDVSIVYAHHPVSNSQTGL